MRHESYINEIEEPCYNVESINGLPSRQQKSMAQYQYSSQSMARLVRGNKHIVATDTINTLTATV